MNMQTVGLRIRKLIGMQVESTLTTRWIIRTT